MPLVRTIQMAISGAASTIPEPERMQYNAGTLHLLRASSALPTKQVLQSQSEKEEVSRARCRNTGSSWDATTCASVSVSNFSNLVHAESVEKAGVVEADV
jgi:hypothetical protein